MAAHAAGAAAEPLAGQPGQRHGGHPEDPDSDRTATSEVPKIPIQKWRSSVVQRRGAVPPQVGGEIVEREAGDVDGQRLVEPQVRPGPEAEHQTGNHGEPGADTEQNHDGRRRTAALRDRPGRRWSQRPRPRAEATGPVRSSVQPTGPGRSRRPVAMASIGHASSGGAGPGGAASMAGMVPRPPGHPVTRGPTIDGGGAWTLSPGHYCAPTVRSCLWQSRCQEFTGAAPGSTLHRLGMTPGRTEATAPMQSGEYRMTDEHEISRRTFLHGEPQPAGPSSWPVPRGPHLPPARPRAARPPPPRPPVASPASAPGPRSGRLLTVGLLAEIDGFYPPQQPLGHQRLHLRQCHLRPPGGHRRRRHHPAVPGQSSPPTHLRHLDHDPAARTSSSTTGPT